MRIMLEFPFLPLLILSVPRGISKFQITNIAPDSFEISGGYHVASMKDSCPRLPQSYVITDTPVRVDAHKIKMKIKYTNGRLLNSQTRDRVFELEKVIPVNVLRFQWCETDSAGYFTCSVKEWTVQHFVDTLNRKDTTIQFSTVHKEREDFAYDMTHENRWQGLYSTKYDCSWEYIQITRHLK